MNMQNVNGDESTISKMLLRRGRKTKLSTEINYKNSIKFRGHGRKLLNLVIKKWPSWAEHEGGYDRLSDRPE